MDYLNLGCGYRYHPEWTNVDFVSTGEGVIAHNLRSGLPFPDNHFEVVYHSHVLEHFHYALDNELLNVLTEWKRVLQPGGQLLISVPDLKTLCWLYLSPNFDPLERHHIMRMMFGGQVNQYDVHKVGLDFEVLGLYLQEVGFEHYCQVMEFGLFNDCSSLRVLDLLISLNVVAQKPAESSE